MAGNWGPERITQWTRNSESRKADMDELIKACPTDETYESSSNQLDKQVKHAEEEVPQLKPNLGE